MIMSGFNASDFDELNEDKKFEIFDKYFPNEWVKKSRIHNKLCI